MDAYEFIHPWNKFIQICHELILHEKESITGFPTIGHTPPCKQKGRSKVWFLEQGGACACYSAPNGPNDLKFCTGAFCELLLSFGQVKVMWPL